MTLWLTKSNHNSWLAFNRLFVVGVVVVIEVCWTCEQLVAAQLSINNNLGVVRLLYGTV